MIADFNLQVVMREVGNLLMIVFVVIICCIC